MLFNQSFHQLISWNNEIYTLGAILPDNQNDINQGMKELSTQSVRNRFLGAKKELTKRELEYLTTLDGFNHFALGLKNLKNEGIGVARMVKDQQDTNQTEIAITIIDRYHGKGLGTLLYQMILLAAYERGADTISVHLLRENQQMQKIVTKIGKRERTLYEHELVTYFIKLSENDILPIRALLEKIKVK